MKSSSQLMQQGGTGTGPAISGPPPLMTDPAPSQPLAIDGRNTAGRPKGWLETTSASTAAGGIDPASYYG